MRGMSIADIEWLEQAGALDQEEEDREILKEPLKKPIMIVKKPDQEHILKCQQIKIKDLRLAARRARIRQIMMQPEKHAQNTINEQSEWEMEDLEILKPPKNWPIKEIEDLKLIKNEDLRRDAKIAQFWQIMEQPMECGEITIDKCPEERDGCPRNHLTQGYPMMCLQANQPIPQVACTVNS